MKNYSKPCVLATVSALAAVQSDQEKIESFLDNANVGTSPAYEADE